MRLPKTGLPPGFFGLRAYLGTQRVDAPGMTPAERGEPRHLATLLGERVPASEAGTNFFTPTLNWLKFYSFEVLQNIIFLEFYTAKSVDRW